MRNPRVQIATYHDLVFGASRGFLRGISIRDGKTRFETYLGDVAPQWKTTVAWAARPRLGSANNPGERQSEHCLLATWPLSVDQRQHTVLLCDSDTGEITQRLQVESEPRELLLTEGGQGILWTEKNLLGLQKSSTHE